MPEPREITLYWAKGLCVWCPRGIYAEGFLLEGQRHGKWVFWYRNGKKQLEGEYVRGKKTGTWTKWREEGARITEGEFLYGKMHGTWTDWHGNGQKALESHWVMGKQDGKWAYFRVDGSLEKTVGYDHKLEEDKCYTIHTDLEATQLVRTIQRRSLHKSWENLVGTSIASIVKPWHIACWVLVFVPALSVIRTKTPWRGAVLAGILALLITSLLAWGLDRREPK